MKPFRYERAADAADAVRAGRRRPGARFLGGGTNLVDLMKLGVEPPGPAGRRHAVCPHDRVERAARRRAADRRRRCATATWPPHPLVRERYPVLAAGAAGRRLGPAAQHGHRRRQPAAAHPLRLLPGRHQAVQQARARAPAARRVEGDHRNLAILGHAPSTASPPTPPTWPSRWPRSTPWCTSPAPAGAARSRSPALHRLPGDEPHRDTVLEPGELITAVELPPRAAAAARATARCATARRSRSRWCSVAAALDVDATARSRDVRIALGGVAHKPWRAQRAEDGAARRAGHRGRLRPARPTPSWPRRGRCPTTRYKVPLARNLDAHAAELAGRSVVTRPSARR